MDGGTFILWDIGLCALIALAWEGASIVLRQRRRRRFDPGRDWPEDDVPWPLVPRPEPEVQRLRERGVI